MTINTEKTTFFVSVTPSYPRAPGHFVVNACTEDLAYETAHNFLGKYTGMISLDPGFFAPENGNICLGEIFENHITQVQTSRGPE
jgi:hypothetical protein